MDRPQVIVNPLAMLAPGIFRDIFQMTPFDPKVQRRDDGAAGGGDENVRASSTSAASRRADARPGTIVGSDTDRRLVSETNSPKRSKQ